MYWPQFVARHANAAAAGLAPRSVLARLCALKRIRYAALLLLLISLLFLTFFQDAVRDWRLAVQAQFAPTTPPLEELSEPPLSLEKNIDWSRFAYGQYVTNSLYLCNSVMFFARLHQLGSRADRVMMYPSKMLPDPDDTEARNDDSRLLIKARDEFAVKLAPIAVKQKSNKDRNYFPSTPYLDLRTLWLV